MQASATNVFGGILERHGKVERIRNVMELLKRFNSLFALPARIQQLAAVEDYDQVVSEYHKAKSILRASASTPRIWISLDKEIERVRLQRATRWQQVGWACAALQ